MKKLSLCCLLYVAAGSALAGDINSFDIAGVRLGMNPVEAKAALQAKCGHDKGKFEVTTVMEPNPYAPGKKYPKTMRCTAAPNETTVYMLAIPSGSIVVDRIIYTMPSNPANEKALKESALAKYGEPTNTITMNSVPEWCIDPSPTFKGGPVCQGAGGPTLRVVRAELQLFDPRYGKQVMDARRAADTTKPSL
jgi:hypothetical protein